MTMTTALPTTHTGIGGRVTDLRDDDPIAEAILRELAEVGVPLSWRDLRRCWGGVSDARRIAVLRRLEAEGRVWLEWDAFGVRPVLVDQV